jgi:uncharacterized membrane protein YphA (DoxX/SURF4 family)
MKKAAYYSISYFLGLIFLMAGIEKFTGLPDIIGPHYLIAEMEKYHLKLFAQFISISELLVGAMLFTNRFRTLGSIMLLPILVCILVVTISLEWKGTPIIIAILLLMNTYLIYFDWQKLKAILSLSLANGIVKDWFYSVPLFSILIGIVYHEISPDTGKLLCRLGLLIIILLVIIDKLTSFYLGNLKKK